MGALATLLNWLTPVLHPLTEFRSNVTKLSTIHQDSVQTFSMLAGGLVAPQTGPEAFTGELSDAFWAEVQTYLNAESALSGAGVGVAEGGVIEEAVAVCEECATEVTGAAEVAAGEIAGDAVLDEITGMVDVAAVAEGGANPIADIGAIVLTVIAGAALIGTLIKLAWDIYHAIQRWQQMMHNIGDTPLPQLPPNPTPVPAPPPTLPPVNLNQDQQKLLKELLDEFPDVSPDLLKELVAAGLTKDQIVRLLTKHAKDIASIWQLLLPLLGIPGIEQVLKDLASNSDTSYRGALHMLNWLVAHQSEVARVEDRDADGNRAIDVFLKDGTVVDLKSYNWYAYKRPGLLDKVIEKLKKQVERDKGLYPNRKIVFDFNSESGPVPDAIRQALENLGVTVETWP